jgi:hypothetical protein
MNKIIIIIIIIIINYLNHFHHFLTPLTSASLLSHSPDKSLTFLSTKRKLKKEFNIVDRKILKINEINLVILILKKA